MASEAYGQAYGKSNSTSRETSCVKVPFPVASRWFHESRSCAQRVCPDFHRFQEQDTVVSPAIPHQARPNLQAFARDRQLELQRELGGICEIEPGSRVGEV